MQKSIIDHVDEVAKEGKRTFYAVHFQDKSKASTFDSKIKGGEAGDTLEWEPIVNGNFINIKDGFILTKHTSQAPGPSSNGKEARPGMTPADWAEKDRLERLSRECNTCFMGLPELFKVHPMKGTRECEVYDAALDWAMAHFKTGKPAQKPAPVARIGSVEYAARPAPEATKSIVEASTDLSKLMFADAGKLKTACKDYLKMSLAQIEKETGGFDLTTEQGRLGAWAQITALYGGKPDEKDSTETQEDPDPDKLFE